jgi:hypothetical protein
MPFGQPPLASFEFLVVLGEVGKFFLLSDTASLSLLQPLLSSYHASLSILLEPYHLFLLFLCQCKVSYSLSFGLSSLLFLFLMFEFTSNPARPLC